MKSARLILAFLWLQAGTALAAPENLDVTDLLRSMHNVQDEIARGDMTALSLQTELANRLKEALENPLGRARDEIEWAVIAIGYALDGANPQVTRRLLARIDVSNPMHELAKAVSEYSTGNMLAAAELFALINLERIDPRLQPYVALAAGTSNLAHDQDKTVHYFEQAALLGPGTLVEEVALRRLVTIAVSKQNANLFRRAANLYIRRYHSSPFAGQFFASVTEEAPSLMDESQMEELVKLIAAQLPKTFVPVLLSLAESNAVRGRLGTVRFIMETYLANVGNTGRLASDKIKLFEVLSAPISRYNKQTLDAVSAIDDVGLTTNERLLLTKLKTTIQQILEPLTDRNNDRAQTVSELYQPKAEPHPSEGATDSGGNADLATEGEMDESEKPTESKGAEPSAEPAAAKAAPTLEVPLTEKAGEDAKATDPVVEEINAASEKTKKTLEAVDNLLKEPMP
ncbi:MAG: hypothetical protein WAT78_04720 [Rhizobiaceae bacterium]